MQVIQKSSSGTQSFPLDAMLGAADGVPDR